MRSVTRAIQDLTESAKPECSIKIKGRHRCPVSDKTRQRSRSFHNRLIRIAVVFELAPLWSNVAPQQNLVTVDSRLGLAFPEAFQGIRGLAWSGAVGER